MVGGERLGDRGGVGIPLPVGNGRQQVIPDRQAGAPELREAGRAGKEEGCSSSEGTSGLRLCLISG